MNHKVIEKKYDQISKSTKNQSSFRIYPLYGPLWISKTYNELPRLVFLLNKSGSYNDDENLGKIQYQVIANAKIRLGSKFYNKPICILQINDLNFCKQFYCFIETFSYEKNRKLFSNQQEIKEYIKRWEELFSTDKALSIKEQIGIWGELCFLNTFHRPEKVVDKWHGPENKKFDFLTSKEGIDVKTSNIGSVHHFSLGQIQAPHAAFIFSLQIMQDPQGLSLEDQIEKLKRKTKSKTCFFQKLVKTRIFQAPIDKNRYSVISQRFLDSRDIPQPRRIDPGVDDLHFRCDVSAAKAVPKKIENAIKSRLIQ